MEATEAALLVVSPIIGSTLGVLIRRLPKGAPVVVARSRCAACGVRLAWFDLVPLLSFAWLRGACRHCGGRIAWFHLWVELAAVAIAVWSIALHGSGAWLDCALGWPLLALAWIDAEEMLLPDALTLPLVAGGLAAAWFVAPDNLADRVLGAALGWASFTLIAVIYRLLRGREGLGGGDAKLLAAAGAWVGWSGLPAVVLVAATSALVSTLVVRAFRPAVAGAPLCFGPWLAAGLWLVWLYG